MTSIWRSPQTLDALNAASEGTLIRHLRAITNHSANEEPKWRHAGKDLTTGYHPTTYSSSKT